MISSTQKLVFDQKSAHAILEERVGQLSKDMEETRQMYRSSINTPDSGGKNRMTIPSELSVRGVLREIIILSTIHTLQTLTYILHYIGIH